MNEEDIKKEESTEDKKVEEDDSDRDNEDKEKLEDNSKESDNNVEALFQDEEPENKEEEKDNKSLKKTQNIQAKWMVFLMIGLILIVVAVPFITKNFINTFDYKGLQFQKTKLGDIIFYSTRFPVVGITGQAVGTYSVNLRSDPRDLDFIPVDITEDRVEFAVYGNKFGDVYISLFPFMEICEDSVISLAALSGFLKDSNLNVKSAYTDKAYAKKHDVEQRWCYNDGFDTVIVVTDGDETSITEIAPNCYELQFSDCEILQVSERFMLLILEEYANRFQDS